MADLKTLLVLFLLALAGAGLAHESRQLGPYKIVIGFLNSPAFAGFPNSLDLRVTEGDKPVEGLEKTLIVEIVAPNGEAFQVDLRPAHGQPGYYRGWFIPGMNGNYVWRVRGRIGDLEVNETFSKFFHYKEAVLDPREYTVPKGR